MRATEQIQKDVETLKDLLVTVKIPSETKRTMNEILTRISASSTEATELKAITHRELKIGDNVDLAFPGGGWSMAKVTDISYDGYVTFFRPWMDATDQYPRVGFEVFRVWQDSDKTVQLFDRKED